MFDRHHSQHWGRDRMFQRGDFKYVILDLLKDKPSHGYEIIRELEERFHGFYSPSPGMVYPTLQFLEEAGYVSASQQDGKKVYAITDEGRKFLADQAATVNDIKDHMRSGGRAWSSDLRDQFRDVMDEVRDLGRLVARRARNMNRDKLRRIGEVLKTAYSEVETIVREEPQSRA